MGTSHRQKPVKELVARVRGGLARAVRTARRVRRSRSATAARRRSGTPRRSVSCASAAHLSLRRVLREVREGDAGAPFLADPIVVRAEPGRAPAPAADASADVLAWAHNETSTGVMVPVERPAGAGDALVLIDATSGAGGLPLDAAQADAYYFAPQKSFASDGGLWLALLSPAAQERIAEIAASGPLDPGLPRPRHGARQQRQGPDLQHAGDRDARAARRAAGLDERGGGLDFCVERTTASSSHLYGWAEASAFAQPFVADPGAALARRRHDRLRRRASTPRRVAATLRANGIVDTEPYRKLGRNQLRIAMFPAIEPDDVESLTACIDWVVERTPRAGETA